MNISEKSKFYIIAIIASIPRKTLDDFKEEVKNLNSEELNYLKQELYFLVSRGKTQYQAAYNAL